MMIVLVGVITWYSIVAFGGQVLYCSTCERPLSLSYEVDNDVEWIALPVGMYVNGQVHCGDSILMITDYGMDRYAALDAGPFDLNCVRQLDGSCKDIIADVPEHIFPGGTKVLSLDAILIINCDRMCEKRIRQLIE